MAETDWPAGEELSEALARNNTLQPKLGPMLELLLSSQDQTLFSDAIITRIRGMLLSIARHVLRHQAEAMGERAADAFVFARSEDLAVQLSTHQPLILHCHALALETQCMDRMQSLYGLDPVLTPLIQDMISSEDAGLASAAMALLASQTRFTQFQKRLELPLTELSADLFHSVLTTWHGASDETDVDSLARAETKLRSEFDEGKSRISLLDRVISTLGGAGDQTLEIDQAGVSLFLSAIASSVGMRRDQAALATHETQIARLLLALRSTGRKPQDCEAAVLRIHPEAEVPYGLDQIGTREAKAMMSVISSKTIG
ncbi:hypothetical protein ACRAQ7_12470 [Erythrobacter sp. W53]|uniref:hypothetical protein n=1 Tax=Erythrobacteraceae TaxID=335929 RepID=UPI0036D382F3